MPFTCTVAHDDYYLFFSLELYYEVEFTNLCYEYFTSGNGEKLCYIGSSGNPGPLLKVQSSSPSGAQLEDSSVFTWLRISRQIDLRHTIKFIVLDSRGMIRPCIAVKRVLSLAHTWRD